MAPTSSRSLLRRGAPLLVVAVAAVVAILLARGLLRRPASGATVAVEPVERRNIVVTVEATGTVEPIHLVEVKSKAPGQILRMPVEVGSVVRAGDLLAQIDTVDVQNQYDQSLAALQAARAQVDVSTAQRRRSDELFDRQVITAEEHESALLAFANAQAALVRARTDLDIARQRLADATVRAPIAGTVIAQPVSAGQVISSATSSVSGGTTLLSMADLRRIRVRALVSESEIGGVEPGQVATVLMDAYPRRPFRGEVEKIEPQAVVQQSVTMFPVLISISNEDGLLMPGMNGEVTILVQRREDVLAVPLDAVRSVRELPAVASALGLDAAALRADLQGQSRAANGGTAAQANDRASGRIGGASSANGASGANGGSGAGRMRGTQAQVVLVKTHAGLSPRVVRLGATDFDYAEVLGGLSEGDRVVLLSVAEIQAQRSEMKDRIRERVGGAVPGTGGGSRSTGRSRSGGP